jgi:hypothetical protein
MRAPLSQASVVAPLLLCVCVCACAHEEPSPPPHAAAPVTTSAGACPAAWSAPPVVASSLVAPDPSLRVVAHVSATGTQNYRCGASAADGGSAFAWTFVGPEASLAGCDGASFGRHFASEGGAAAPKWQAPDGSFVVGKKVAAEPSTEAGAVPWLLLKVSASGGSGALGGVAYVQRTQTKGGVMPADGCDAAHAGSEAKVPYSADYWFLGHDGASANEKAKKD